MDTLTKTVYDVVMGYARKGLNSQSYFTHNDANTIFSVVTVTANNTSFVSLLVRISNSVIIVEQDRNDKALVDALLQAGIQRESISLAYKGEPIPAAA
jgi:XisI protein